MSEKKGKPHALRLRKLAEASALETGEEFAPDAEGAEAATSNPRGASEPPSEPQPHPARQRKDRH